MAAESTSKVTFDVTLTGGRHVTGEPKFRITYSSDYGTYSTVGHSATGAVRSALAHGVSEAAMRAALAKIGVK
jgi:hypothetical protein